MYVTGATRESVQSAKKQMESLIKTVKKQYLQFKMSQPVVIQPIPPNILSQPSPPMIFPTSTLPVPPPPQFYQTPYPPQQYYYPTPPQNQ